MKRLVITYLHSIAENTKQVYTHKEFYFPALKIPFSGFPLEKGSEPKVPILYNVMSMSERYLELDIRKKV